MADESCRDWEVLTMSTASIDPKSSAAATNSSDSKQQLGESEDKNKVSKEKEELTVGMAAWLQRQSSEIVLRARQSNPLLSLAVAAAAVVGLVILGRGWHRERCENRLLRSQLGTRVITIELSDF
ncbi:uncharacterized protein LOC112340713 [Selaginella moellendorffii]|uniref:uncharacterized protein LOC112340713 n=1 Tax=Selaginella moellendorffii TaxID=88036 RepID=UPI000D1D015F|nr:uncharacterized protein LOC112340713 [Selaginella moellendorffii]|eukprot:XP_024515343.1 uncharacterized protein LOC112340713 [Selaginella moellendorffii]